MKENQASLNSDILKIALRVGAVVIAVNMIDKFPGFYGSYSSNGAFDWYSFAGFLLLPSLIALFISALMWFSPSVFLKSMQTETNLANQTVTSFDIGNTLIAVIGLYVLSFSIGDLVYTLTFIKLAKDQLGTPLELMPENIAELAATIIEIIIGIALISGSRSISILITHTSNREQDARE